MKVLRSLLSKGSMVVFLCAWLTACGGGGSVSDDPVTPTADTPAALNKGERLTGLSGDTGSETLFILDVSDDAKDLTFTTSGGSGDVDLYVRYENTPTTGAYDCRSATLDTNDESCVYNDPPAGTYHVMLHGDASYADVELMADYEGTPIGGGGDPGGGGGACTYSAIQRELLEAHNAARAEARLCGTESFPAVPPLELNCELTEAAVTYSIDMRDNGAWNHVGSDGSSPGDRALAAGYGSKYVGENIAAGYPDVDAVMNGWLSSPGHCKNIMRSGYTEMGAGVVYDGSYPYWTIDFGRL